MVVVESTPSHVTINEPSIMVETSVRHELKARRQASSSSLSSNKRPNAHHHKTTSSKSIPIAMPNHVRRTESEKNLQEDELFAETRDWNMYHRIVTGIMRQQTHAIHNQVRSLDYLYETDACIENIHRSRYQHPDDIKSLHARHKREWKTNSPSEEQENEWMLEANNGFLSPTFPQFEDEDHIFVLDL